MKYQCAVCSLNHPTKDHELCMRVYAERGEAPPKPMPKGYLDQHCLLCASKPVRYVKTKGGFHKVCDLCAGVLEMAGLLVEPDRIYAMKQSKGA